jgi:hypothetical protein
MTNRAYLKCEVCGAVTIIRVQVGWLDWHPIIVPCGNCLILISGIARFDQQRGTTHYEFHNASETEARPKPDYYLEISGELPTDKIRPWEGDDFVWSPPPFFQSFWGMGHENYEVFKSKTLTFLARSKELWPKVRRINELWNAGQTQYLASEIHKYLPQKQFPMNNDVEMLRGVHQINLLFFSPVQDDDYLTRATKSLMPAILNTAKQYPEGFLDLLHHFVPSDLLKHYENKIFLRMQSFVDLFRSVIPAFAQRFYSQPVGPEKGMTTAGFDELKHYYADTYETLTEVMPLVIAFNNLKYRGDYKVMKALRRDVITFEDFLHRSKGERVQYLDGAEFFDSLLYPALDNKLRNAIAHNSYTYDRVAQDVTYYPSGKTGEGDERHLSLLQFADRCWQLTQRLMDFAELLYQTRKNSYVFLHGQMTVSPEVFQTPKRKAKKKDVKAQRKPRGQR